MYPRKSESLKLLKNFTTITTEIHLRKNIS